MTEHEELPASEVVARFGDEIKAAITAAAEAAPTVAKSEARNAVKNEARRSAVWWYVTSLIMSLVMSLAVSWLMLNYAPRSHAPDITYRRGVTAYICVRDQKLSSEAHPIYICDTH